MPLISPALDRARQLHRFLVGRSFYALVLASALACALVVIRIERLGSWHYRWLIWNLILAWVPYAAGLGADLLRLRWPARPWGVFLPAGLWLAFLPNAPYLVTDLMHLRPSQGLPWLFWYDIVTLALFAWTGCVLGAVSLAIMQGIVAAYLGRAVGWLFVLGTAGLCGVGIYLGRFGRWNSWDLVANPRALAADLAGPLLHPTAYLRPLALCALFAAFFLVSYLTLGARVRVEERA